MITAQNNPISLNVALTVLDEKGKVVSKHRFKNTATKRLTEGIAMFLAGDSSTELKGRWRPNFIAFATTGIDRQPTATNPNAYVEDPDKFASLTLPEGERTRPGFYSTCLGERTDGFWKPEYGWGTAENPNVPCFQGELSTEIDLANSNLESTAANQIIHRQLLLRADVTEDATYFRDFGTNGYGSDCIFYSYSSVLWSNQFFTPEHGPSVPRIAISEFGLYEGDCDNEVGRYSLMAGFRVPTVNDIIYLEPGYVTLVEWRVTIRSLMPYEGVRNITQAAPIGVSVMADLINGGSAGQPKRVQLTGLVFGEAGVNTEVSFTILDEVSSGTYLTLDPNNHRALLTISEDEPLPFIRISVNSAVDPNIRSTVGVVTGLITDLVTGITTRWAGTDADDNILFEWEVLGIGSYSQEIIWGLSGNTSSGTFIETVGDKGVLHVDPDEESKSLVITATSTERHEIYTIAAMVTIGDNPALTSTYVISDFTIETEGEG